MGTKWGQNVDLKSVYLTNWPKQGNSLKKKKLFCWQKYWSIWIFLITELTFTDKLPWDSFKLVCVITSNQIVHIRWWLHAFKPKIDNGDLMGANGGPKTEEGPHGDLGLQMRTHVGAVLRLNLATTWHHLHWLQVWPPDAAICFSCKFGHQMAPLALPHCNALQWLPWIALLALSVSIGLVS